MQFMWLKTKQTKISTSKKMYSENLPEQQLEAFNILERMILFLSSDS